ncbi:hypothetical protein C8F04DRAFT_1284870 [Mycena alexandri]|uniref:DUF2415 domain-containing protein n=1 Tax=Mycena alexandri TaxID=1745969 RepID=A0AAD6RVV9_9AGAR|nr:hypothetical protein C8F04DRAFT_1284870 [Mycena alexandri]
MARDPPLLASPVPTLRSPAKVTIGHVQLRDVIICPRERGIVNYVQERSIVENNLLEPEKPPRTLAELSFLPNTLASLQVPNTDQTLLAAGGQDAEIYLSLLTSDSRSTWQLSTHLEGSINNSILLTSLSLTDSNQNSAEPRMAVSNNDRVVMFFDVPIRSRAPTINPVGAVRFNVPVNHYGSKYAVASQEGAVAVWDVRSTKPLRVFHTDKSRGSSSAGDSTTWLSEDPQEWSLRKSRGPGWSARNVKFGGRPGRELMLFTEHTSLIHVIDARTFETEEILHMPAFPAPAPPPPLRQRASAASRPSPSSPSALATARIVRTLEDTFRIAAGEDVLVIPPLGDRAVEREEMEEVTVAPGRRGEEGELEDEDEQEQECVVSAPPPSREEEADLDVERNLAGACFDPSGSYVYVASDTGVAEWGVRGAEKRWWVDGAWER